MINIFDKAEIIALKNKGLSTRQVAKVTGLNRKTVTRVWKRHTELQEALSQTTDKDHMRELQQEITCLPKYDSSSRKRVKFNQQMEDVIDLLLEKEKEKNEILGKNHKQRITNVQIHQELLDRGFDIGLTTVRKVVCEKRDIIKETYIRQCYNYGQRLEVDFGEVALVIDGVTSKYYLAVLSSPASGYRQAYLYTSQNKQVFLDAHVRFFEDVGGVYEEVVYDNMKNVVTKFIGRNEKQLNHELIKLALYYGFEVNVTNCYSGNEKGHVEGSVKFIRNRAFSLKYEFKSLDDAREHLKCSIDKINLKSTIELEKQSLKPYRPKLELAQISKIHVSKYSVIRFENNFYSVPEALNGKEVTVKNYLEEIEVFYKHERVYLHKKIDGYLNYRLEITHFLKTLITKPGAIKNSQALANNPKIKTIYDSYYTKNPKRFIELVCEYKHLSGEELNQALIDNRDSKSQVKKIEDKILHESMKQIISYTKMIGANKYENN